VTSEQKHVKKVMPSGTFLVVNGQHVVPINKSSLSIGRKADNDVIIDSQHVSRHHAEIRCTNGYFFIIDLETTAGTSINGKRIKKALLKPGDVLSLGGVPVIFGQGIRKASQQKDKKTPPLTTDTDLTESVNINDADQYLELFNYHNEQ